MPTSLLFSNVPFDCTEPELRQWIEDRFFPVVNVTLIRDIISGTSPSFAYVDVSEEDIKQAEQMLNGQSLKGRTLRVRRVVPMQASIERERAAGSGR
jgi:RNA recognition motif-containing protein